MNCKPGDLAVILGTSRWAGLIVEVMYEAPASDFRLPDGMLHVGCEPGWWVIRFIGGPVRAPIYGSQRMRLACYGAGTDRKLRPIRGLPDDCETPVCTAEPTGDVR